MRTDPSTPERSTITTHSPPATTPGEITEFLRAWNRDDPLAENKLFDLVYPQLHSIAAQGLAREPPHVGLEPTELLHEAYIRLVDQRVSWQNRAHFFATVAKLIRRILGDHAKHRGRLKRGNGAAHLSLDDIEPAVPAPDLDSLALNQVLAELDSLDRTAARVVALRYFEGLSLDEVAKLLHVGRATVVRSWSFARAFLGRRLRPDPSRSPSTLSPATD